MTKQVRDGSATIRRAKLMLAKTEVKQWYKEFLANPTQDSFAQLTHLLENYLQVSEENQVTAPVIEEPVNEAI